MKSLFTSIKIKEISFPFILRNKTGNNEKIAIANITIGAKAERKYKNELKDEVLKIISGCVSYCGLNNLLTLLLRYINSIHAVKAEIICTYPYFIFRKIQRTDKGYLKKYLCTLSLKKQSLLKYKKKFSVEVPVLRKNYRVPGYESKTADISTNLLVEIEGFETFYTEDIADVIEKYTDGIVENYNSRLADNVKKELSAKYSFDKCTVKLIDRKINTAKIPGFNSAVVHSERHLNENNYLYGIC